MDDDQWVHLSPDRRERIEAGIKALARIHKHRDFHDWHLVGQACLDLQQAVMTAADVDNPTNSAYSTMFGKFIDASPQYRPLAEIDESVRSNAIWMTQNWDAVLEWHTELKDHIRRLVNHPTTVRRRFKIDKQIHPLPPPKDEPKDDPTEDDPTDPTEDEEEGETKAKRDKPIHDPAEDDPVKDPPPPPSPESYIADFDQLWQHVKDHWNRSPPAARTEMTKRITQWLHDSKEVPNNTRVETDLIDESIHESIRSVNKTDGAEITAITRRKVEITTSENPQPEHTALVVRDALSKPIVEGEDIFAGLGDDVGAEKVTPEQIRALQPATTITESKVRALHHNNPSWDDATLAKELGYQETTVRRVLDKFRP